MVEPGVLFDRNAREYLVPGMSELGFIYLGEERELVREQKPFTQKVYFEFRKATKENYCEIKPILQITSDCYERWFRKAWDAPPDTARPNLLCSEPAYGLEGWPKRGNFLTKHLPWRIRPGLPLRLFYLRNNSGDRQEMMELQEALLGPLIGAFKKMTSWEWLANYHAQVYVSMSIGCDLYLIAGNREKALKVLESALSDQTLLQSNNLSGVVESLEQRRERYFGSNGLFLSDTKGQGETQ